MQYFHYQNSDRESPAVYPYKIVNTDVYYLYMKQKTKNLYYLEFQLGVSLHTKINENLKFRTAISAGLTRSPQYIGPNYKIVGSAFSQHGSLGLIYIFSKISK